MQGDLVDACPVLVFDGVPDIANAVDFATVVDALDDAHAVQPVRVIVMTQACDLAEDKVRNVILCPVYHVEEYRRLWEAPARARGQNPTDRSFTKTLTEVKGGRVWNLTMLDKRDRPEEGGLSIPIQIVDFHEVFSLPLTFLRQWVRTRGTNRLRLSPPYREHLSQAFARFFMRVGLPIDIDLP